MKTITKRKLITWIKEISAQSNHFDCEYDFQFNLALKIKEKLESDSKSKLNNNQIGFEKKIYDDKRCRCDLVIFPQNKSDRILLELKYVCTSTDCQSEKSTINARESFVKDYERIKQLIKDKKAKSGFVIFLTNKTAVFKNDKGEESSKNDKVQFFHKLATKKNWKNCPFADKKDTKLLVLEVDNENKK